LLALDAGVAEEDDAVDVAEFKARRRGGGAGDGESEEDEQGGAEERACGEGVRNQAGRQRGFRGEAK
jgi:hypothetical protein